MSACQRRKRGGGKVPPFATALARTCNCLLLLGPVCHQNLHGEDRQLYYCSKDNPGCSDPNTSRHDTLCELQVQLPVSSTAKITNQLLLCSLKKCEQDFFTTLLLHPVLETGKQQQIMNNVARFLQTCC